MIISAPNPFLWSLGLMSGTSLDGIDAAIIQTDGVTIKEWGPSLTIPYPSDFQKRLQRVLGTQNHIPALEQELTEHHVTAVNNLLEEWKGPIDLIGFHGQTIYHAPPLTIQWGDGDLLAQKTGIPVISDFRSNDCQNGGQGAPLVPLYHQSLCHDMEEPVVILNLGGVGNITYIHEETLIGFDTGPGNALIDDFMKENLDQPYDLDGKIASLGKPDIHLLNQWLLDPYFSKPYPKSLDRDHFKKVTKGVSGLNGLATLTAFTAFCVFHSLQLLPGFKETPPKSLIVCGGGRRNKTIFRWLTFLLPKTTVILSDDLGEKWNGDFIEAQAFAFLAVRSLHHLPLSLPSTTGVKTPLSGGKLSKPKF